NGTSRAEGGELDFTALGNANFGQIQVGTGNTVFFTSGLARNDAMIALTGGTFDNNTSLLTNFANIVGHGAIRAGGINNSATITLAGFTSDVFSPLNNLFGGRVTVTANGTATFYGDVFNDAGAAFGVVIG